MRFRCTEKIICAEPDDNPLTPFSSAGQDSPKALACEAIICAPSYSPITGSPVGDNPVMNLSSEEPDRDIFIGEIWGVDKPGLNKFWSLGCHGWCESVISQGDADACAERSWTECSRTYWNTPQICSYACAGGQFKVYTQPAHTFVADTQAKANSYAHQYACWMAYYIAMCGPGGPGGGGGGVPASPIPPAQPPAHPLYTNTEQSCTKTCNNGQPKTFTVPPGFMYAGSVNAANAAAQSYACQKATQLVQTDCGFDVWNQEQTATVTCPDSTTQTATVAANTYGTTLLSGGADAIAAAQQQMNDLALSKARDAATAKCSCTIQTSSPLPNGKNGAAYSTTLTGTGSAPKTWSVVAGSLPPGLTLNASTGVISGTATQTDPADIYGNRTPFAFTIKLVAT